MTLWDFHCQAQSTQFRDQQLLFQLMRDHLVKKHYAMLLEKSLRQKLFAYPLMNPSYWVLQITLAQTAKTHPHTSTHRFYEQNTNPPPTNLRRALIVLQCLYPCQSRIPIHQHQHTATAVTPKDLASHHLHNGCHAIRKKYNPL